jgi:hypothetical protein
LDDVKELVVTLDVANKKIVKVEEVEASGTRHPIADEDFAELVGEDEQETLVAALEEAYAAGAEDALEDETAEDEGDGEARRRTILWEAAARQNLRRSVRRLILGRALQRISTTQKRAKPAQAAAKGTSNAKPNQQQRA